MRFGYLLALCLVACDRAPPPPPPAPAAPAASPRAHAPAAHGRAGDLQYLEVVSGGADAGKELPLIVAIHGLGDEPRSFATLFRDFPAKARIALPRAPEPWGSGWSWFAYRPSISDAELADGISAASDRLARTIDEIARSRPTVGRPIVTGFSQGGMLSFALAARHPASLRVAVPVGGTLPEPLWPAAFADGAARPRVVALHGASDTRVPPEPARRAIEVLGQRGFDASIETFPGVGHSIPPPVRQRLFAVLRDAVAGSR